MKKLILIIISLLFFIGCNDKNIEPYEGHKDRPISIWVYIYSNEYLTYTTDSLYNASRIGREVAIVSEDVMTKQGNKLITFACRAGYSTWTYGVTIYDWEIENNGNLQNVNLHSSISGSSLPVYTGVTRVSKDILTYTNNEIICFEKNKMWYEVNITHVFKKWTNDYLCKYISYNNKNGYSSTVITTEELLKEFLEEEPIGLNAHTHINYSGTINYFQDVEDIINEYIIENVPSYHEIETYL